MWNLRNLYWRKRGLKNEIYFVYLARVTSGVAAHVGAYISKVCICVNGVQVCVCGMCAAREKESVCMCGGGAQRAVNLYVLCASKCGALDH
jgi:hypothetical protein